MPPSYCQLLISHLSSRHTCSEVEFPLGSVLSVFVQCLNNRSARQGTSTSGLRRGCCQGVPGRGCATLGEGVRVEGR